MSEGGAPQGKAAPAARGRGKHCELGDDNCLAQEIEAKTSTADQSAEEYHQSVPMTVLVQVFPL